MASRRTSRSNRESAVNVMPSPLTDRDAAGTGIVITSDPIRALFADRFKTLLRVLPHRRSQLLGLI